MTIDVICEASEAKFVTYGHGRLTAIQIGAVVPPPAPPFAGSWVMAPSRNLVKLGAAIYDENTPDAALLY